MHAARPIIQPRRRKQRTAFVRQLAMYLCRSITGTSFPVIGRHFGRHHVTAIYACRSVKRRMARQPVFRQFIEELEGVIVDRVSASREGRPMMLCSDPAVDASASGRFGPVMLELSGDPVVQIWGLPTIARGGRDREQSAGVLCGAAQLD